jgi:hypothetical protein
MRIDLAPALAKKPSRRDNDDFTIFNLLLSLFPVNSN